MAREQQVQKIYPLSPMQEGMLFHSLLEQNSELYFEQLAFTVQGTLDLAKFRNSFEFLIDRYEIFRTGFVHQNVKRPVQVVLRQRPAVFIYENITPMAETEKSSFCDAYQQADRRRGFDLVKDMLIRVSVIQTHENKYQVIWSFHHIIIDGWCIGIIIREFFRIYQSLLAGQTPELDKTPPYSDFIEWLERQDKKAALKFWEEYLEGYQTAVAVPKDRPEGENTGYNRAEFNFTIDEAITARLQQLATGLHVTPNNILQTAWGILLQGYNQTSDVAFGAVISGRPAELGAIDQRVGLFINTVPVRIERRPGITFSRLLQQVRQSNNTVEKYGYIPLAEIQSHSLLRQDLINHLFIFENYPLEEGLTAINAGGSGDFTVTDFTSFEQTNYDFNLLLQPGSRITVKIYFNANVYSPGRVREMMRDFTAIMDGLLAEPELEIGSFLKDLQLSDKFLPSRNSGENITRLAVAATFTADPIRETVEWWCRQFGIEVKTEFAPYNQVFQELLDDSGLLSTNQDINLLLVRFEDWLRDDPSPAAQKLLKLERNFRELTAAFSNRPGKAIYFCGILPITALKTALKTVSGNFEEPIHEKLLELNYRWQQLIAETDNVYPVDLRELAGLYELREIFDPIKDRAGHLPFSDEYYAAMGTAIARKVIGRKQLPFKVIVLDCDNTLWSGVCGEAGALGVKAEGPYQLLQQFMLHKKQEGMLLAVCSKNNEADVWEVFATNPGMVLRKEDLAGWRINWQPKSENLRDLARELNLGLESFIFIDDNPLECAEVMNGCPQVLALQLPADAGSIPEYLKHIWAFDRLQVTAEDGRRTQMYREEKKRQEFQEALSLDEFINNLELKVAFGFMNPSQLSRVAQLTQRTNQFNLSTIRRTEEEITALLATDGVRIWVVEAADRFGDYGLVGVIITREEPETLFIDTLLLSCRVLGRKVEDTILTGLKRYCRERGKQIITARYYPTAKNEPAFKFLERTGWEPKEITADYTTVDYTTYELNPFQIPELMDAITFYYQTPLPRRLDAGTSRTENDIGQVVSNGFPVQIPAGLGLTGSSLTGSSLEYKWEVPPVNEANFLHKGYFAPLKYHTGRSLLRLPLQKSQVESVSRPEYIPPRNDMERQLAAIWEELLQVERIGIHDNFFKLGGHSLKATILISRIHKVFQVEVPLRQIFQTPTIAGLAGNLAKEAPGIYSAIQPIPISEYYPLSAAQKRLFIIHQIDSKNLSYNLPGAFWVEGELNRDRLEETFRKLIKRHESLRTSFDIVAGEPVQRIQAAIDFAISYWETDEAGVDALCTRIIAGFVRPFDLSRAPLFRAGLLKLADLKHLLFFDVHHIIFDGTSMGILMKEFIDLYGGQEPPALRIQYKDYTAWQNELLASGKIEAQESYWMGRFDGEIPVLNLPADYPRPSIQSFEGERFRFEIGRELTHDVRKLVNVSGTTLYMVLLTALNILLSKYTGQEDIIVGSPIAGRPHADLERIIGVFINTLAMRNQPVGDKSFREFLAEVKENSLKAQENQDYPFEELVQKLKLRRDLSRNPLFDVMFILQNTHRFRIESSGLKFSPYDPENKTVQFDLTLNTFESEDKIANTFEYCTKLFARETIAGMADSFLHILQIIVANPAIKLADIEVLTPVEKRRILTEFNRTQKEYPKSKLIHQLFTEQAVRTPEQIALQFKDTVLTYRELDARSNQLAVILQEKGVEPDQPAGIMVNRSLEMIVGILAILKAGGAYLPIDPEYPGERIKYMLADSGAKLLLTQKELALKAGFDGTILDITEPSFYQGKTTAPAVKNTARDLAYIIYTSGSTGKPKGVMITHQAVHNFITGITDRIEFTPDKSILALTTISFDIFGLETLLPLTGGLRVVIADESEQRDPKRLSELIAKNRIRMLQLTPSRLQILLGDADYPSCLESVTEIMIGGEAVQISLINEVRKWTKAKIYNMYGPTETTIWSAVKDLTASAAVNIGTPIANTQIYIVDRHLKPVPVGVAGELCIAGDGLARGYLGRPELTAEKFVSNPDFFQTSNFELQTSSHLYKTGDLARWLPDGNIEFLGRMDHQVKIRGYRIELGEIESRLLQHKAVKEAVAVSKTGPDGNQFLCAYMVWHGNEGLTVGELREFLARELPDYMIPSYFIPMEQIPLTANGKVDRKALAGSSKTLKPEAKLQTGVEYVAPRNEIEAKLAAVWQEVLGIERIGITEDFFEIGGDSIKAMLIVSSLRKQELKLEIKHFFQQKNIEKLAPYVESYHEEGSREIVTGVIDLITTQKGFFRKTRTDINHWNISVMLFKKDRFEETAIAKVFQKLVEHHDALRIIFTMEGEQVTQYNRGLEGKLFELKVFDCREDGADTTRMDEEVYALHRSMDLTRGPLVKLGLFQREDGDHLLIIMHHLIGDGISMRLILEDFAAGYRQAVQNEEIRLSEKTSSLKEWSEQLSVYANSQELLQELDYWKALEKTSVPPLPKDQLSSENRRQDDETLSAVLLTDQETKMLFKANPAFAANVKVSLLAAFGASIREWTGADQVMVDYKIHGREDIFKGIDVTRTVGWFATEFPLILDISQAHDLSALMESIEGIFRNLPGRGLGYETLREMTLPQNKAPLTFNLNPEILFNYSGEVNQSIHTIFNDFGFSPLFKNLNESPDSERKYTLIVELGIVMGQVNINLHYNRHEYDEKTMNGFIESYRKNLFRLFVGGPASIANSAMEMNQEQADAL